MNENTVCIADRMASVVSQSTGADWPPQKRRRGPSMAKTAMTRARISEAALDVFLSEGFEKARVSDIARTAQIAKGTVYLYFDTKDALFEAVLAGTVANTLSALNRPEVTVTGSVQDFMREVVGQLVKTLEDPRRSGLFRLIIAEGPRFPGLLAAYRRSVFDPMMTVMHMLAAAAESRGEITNDALARFPMLILSPGLLLVVWNGLFPAEAISPQNIFEAFFDLVFGKKPETSAQSEGLQPAIIPILVKDVHKVAVE